MNGTNSPWLLIVEDENTIREALVQILAEEGYRTSAASDGREAWQLITDGRENAPALIVADLLMPRFNGRELCLALQADETLRKIPVIVISADVVGVGEARSLGAAACLRKPFDMARLLELVAQHLPQSAVGVS